MEKPKMYDEKVNAVNLSDQAILPTKKGINAPKYRSKMPTSPGRIIKDGLFSEDLDDDKVIIRWDYRKSNHKELQTVLRNLCK